MTRDDFLATLATIAPAYHWQLNENGALRAYIPADPDPLDFCPITAATWSQANLYYDAWSWDMACELLDLDGVDALDIVLAADNQPDQPEGLRARLLAAVGLPEESA